MTDTESQRERDVMENEGLEFTKYLSGLRSPSQSAQEAPTVSSPVPEDAEDRREALRTELAKVVHEALCLCKDAPTGLQVRRASAEARRWQRERRQLMTNPNGPIRLPAMGRGVRWSDIVAEIQRDDEPDLPPTAEAELEAS